MSALPPSVIGPLTGGAVDISQLPKIRTTTPAVEVALTKEQAASYQKGEIDFRPVPDPSMPPMVQAVAPTAAQPPPPAYQPGIANQAAIPTPTSPQDTPRVRDRINDLYGKWKTAEERAAGAEERVAELLSRFEARLTQPPVPPYTNQYGSYPGSPAPFQPQQAQPQFEPVQEPGPAAGQFVSRAELQALLFQNSQAAARVAALSHQHTVNRLEAERRFPDVANNPELRQAADDIFANDRAFSSDPRGYEKAYAMTRGLYYDPSAPAPLPQVPADVRKANLTSLGPSPQVEGSTAGPDDRTKAYYDMLAYAQRTGRLEDFARAHAIKPRG